MKRTVPSLGLILILLVLGACGVAPEPTSTVPLPPPGRLPFAEGFEDETGWQQWNQGADVPADPNRPGEKVAWSIVLSDEQAGAGSRSARLALDGRQDDGTIWLARRFESVPGDEVQVRLAFDLWSAAESSNTLANVAVYAGPQPPASEADFDLSQPADQAAGWKRYSYGLSTETGPAGELWVAVGISVVWETEVTYYLDEIQIEADSGSGGSPPPLGGEGEARPPAAILRVGDQQQEAGIGSYCWTGPVDRSGQAVGVCADAIGLITPRQPLAVSSPLTATFDLGPEPPATLALRAVPVTAESAVNMGEPGADWQAWRPEGGQEVPLAPVVEPSTRLDLEPGLYVLDLFVTWPNSNSASYGFLLKVGGAEQEVEPAGFVVEEYPVVAVGEDTPTHLEYMARIDPQILERRASWRQPAPEDVAARLNEDLAPFGYRLEPKFDSDWNQTFYDLIQAGSDEPLLPRLSRVWPPAVSAAGDDLVMAAENAPNVEPFFVLVQPEGVTPWQSQDSNMLPPVYVGNEQAAVIARPGGGVDLEYTVWVGGRQVYTGTEPMMVEHPVRGFSGWDGHWALELEDRVIVDGQDPGVELGYDKVFGFAIIGGQPFYFYEQAGTVRLSYAGQTLPQTYEEVVHNQCCEPSMFNVAHNADMVWFHARREGTWYYVEAGLYALGEMAGSGDRRYTSPEGWSFAYPASWDGIDAEGGFVQETTTGKTISFHSEPTTEADLVTWIEAEMERKLAATEASNSLAEILTVEKRDGLQVYRYAILSETEGAQTLLRTTVFFDGQRRYELYAAIPPVTGEEYRAAVDSFRPVEP